MMLSARDFLVNWHLRRDITDHAGQMSGVLSGNVTFTETGGGALRYREDGTFTLASGAVFAAQRSYYWRWNDDRVDVTFSDGAAFHQFLPIGVGAGTAHLCGEDLYNVTYDFSQWPSWSAVWQVQGPRKDYTSVSHYTQV